MQTEAADARAQEEAHRGGNAQSLAEITAKTAHIGALRAFEVEEKMCLMHFDEMQRLDRHLTKRHFYRLILARKLVSALSVQLDCRIDGRALHDRTGEFLHCRLQSFRCRHTEILSAFQNPAAVVARIRRKAEQ